jgi:hypothetical protein
MMIQAADPVVGFSLVGSGLAGRASAAAPTQSGYLPDLNQVDSWVTIGADDTGDVEDEPDRGRERDHDGVVRRGPLRPSFHRSEQLSPGLPSE